MPWTGTIFVLLGALAVLLFGGALGLVLGLLLIVAGILFYLGRPRPRRLAYWVAAGVPILVGGLTIVMVAFHAPRVSG